MRSVRALAHALTSAGRCAGTLAGDKGVMAKALEIARGRTAPHPRAARASARFHSTLRKGGQGICHGSMARQLS